MSLTNSDSITANNSTTHKRPIGWLIMLLVLLSAITFSARVYFSGTDTLAAGDTLWRLSINISTHATPEITELKIYPPFDTANIHTIERNLSYPGFRVRKSTDSKKYQRNVFISANEKGIHQISAAYLLHLSQTQFSTPLSKIDLSTPQRESFLLNNTLLQFKSYTVKKTLDKLQKNHPNQDELIESIFSFLKKLPLVQGNNAVNVPQVLNRNKASLYERSLAMVSLCRASGIPARLVTGMILKDSIEPQPHYWVEIFKDKQWLSYDVNFGYKNNVPINYLPLRRDDKNIVEIIDGSQNHIEYYLEQEFDHPYLRLKQKYNLLSIFDLKRLSLDVRNELAILLLLPLGALITSFFKHLLGLKSYGVFTPTLLALALVYTNYVTTLIVFLVVITLAVVGRSVFPTTLTRMLRLSMIFTLIAIILSMSVSVLNYFNIDQGGKIILLPVIILTSLVDRFYKTTEDKGLNIALARMVWTIFIALLCLPIVQFETLGHIILQFPEIHFTTLAIFLLISLYKGKHFIHIPYLSILAEPNNTNKKETDKPHAS